MLNVLVCCVGFSLMPLAPITLELCAENAYPAREYVSTGARVSVVVFSRGRPPAPPHARAQTRAEWGARTQGS